jgi:hypothetical protein
MVTAANLLREMQSFVNVPSTVIAKAETIGMNTDNSSEFSQLVEAWGNGTFDEDPDYVVQEIEGMLE